jgi:hypothetical protein
MSHFGENVIARERSDQSNLFSQHNEIASPPSAARNDNCDNVELVSKIVQRPLEKLISNGLIWGLEDGHQILVPLAGHR